MGQGNSSPAPPVGSAERQSRRHAGIWRRSAVPGSESFDNAESAFHHSRPAADRRRSSVNRLSQLLQSRPTSRSHSSARENNSRSLRPSRLQRARNSVLFSAPSLFPRRSHTPNSDSLWPESINREPRLSEPVSAESSQVSLASPDSRTRQIAEAIESLTASGYPNTTSSPRSSSRRSSIRLPTSLSDRLSSFRSNRTTSGTNAPIRGRRSGARQGEDNTQLLSRLLSVAAAATAATLLDGDQQAISQARGTAVDGDDGSFDSFLRSLESGRLAAALRQGTQAAVDAEEGIPTRTPPLNFFRMFRFGAGAGANAQQSPTPSSNDNRMVPIIIVGIRAVTPGNASGSEDSGVPPFLDALSALPTTPLNASSTTARQGASANHARTSHRRRASMGGVSRISSTNESHQRDIRSPEAMRPRSVTSDATSFPRPPPATPASPSLSAVTSRNATPAPTAPTSRRASFSSTPRRESIIRTTTTTTLESTSEDDTSRSRTARHRRLSESDRRNSTYSSRRNGIVEPDNTPAESSRSWIIYVLGGSYPENHPILTTPSLFTDSPTYEDMMMLSAMLGPAKPPVASEKDIASAGGIYRIELVSDSAKTAELVAVATDGHDRVTLQPEERCLVCLCDFEKDEEARRLNKCNHLFHKECIDAWLTKGRNSCPLCRAQGVNETEKKSEEARPVDSAAPSPEIPSAPEVVST